VLAEPSPVLAEPSPVPTEAALPAPAEPAEALVPAAAPEPAESLAPPTAPVPVAPLEPPSSDENVAAAAEAPAASLPATEPEDSAPPQQPDDRDQPANSQSAPVEASDEPMAEVLDEPVAEAPDEPVTAAAPDPESVTSDATSPEPDLAAAAEAPSTAPDPQMEVTVVPGVPRYHTAQCILIRFMGENDLEKMTVAAARDSGCTPCRACQPDLPESSAE
jgi:hypothetical protein